MKVISFLIKMTELALKISEDKYFSDAFGK